MYSCAVHEAFSNIKSSIKPNMIRWSWSQQRPGIRRDVIPAPTTSPVCFSRCRHSVSSSPAPRQTHTQIRDLVLPINHPLLLSNTKSPALLPGDLGLLPLIHLSLSTFSFSPCSAIWISPSSWISKASCAKRPLLTTTRCVRLAWGAEEVPRRSGEGAKLVLWPTGVQSTGGGEEEEEERGETLLWPRQRGRVAIE